MKIRNGFVSNSSSSSFILSAKNSKALNKATISVTVNLNKYVEKVITNLKELETYNDEYEPDETTYERMKNEIVEGNIVFVGSLSDDGDDILEAYLCHAGLPPVNNIVIVQSEGGY